MKKIKLIIIGLTALVSFNLLAWWDFGHFLTASVAEKNLTPEAIDGINKCLSYPISYPSKPSNDFTPADMVNCATWLDNIKVGKWNNNTDKEKFSSIHFSDMFYDVAFPIDDYSTAYQKVLRERILTKYNSLKSTESCIKSLTSKTSQAEKAVALKTLIHLLGDIHCPMHSIDPTINDVGTRGGNSIRFDKADGIVFYDTNNFPTKITNMHMMWDGMGGAYLSMPYPVLKVDYTYLKGKAEDLTAQYLSLDDGPMDINAWAVQTLIVGEEGTTSNVVTYPFSKNTYPKIKDYKGFYAKFAQEKSKTQVYLAGKRLAGILMAIFDPQHAQKKYLDLVNSIKNNSDMPTLQEYMEFQFK